MNNKEQEQKRMQKEWVLDTRLFESDGTPINNDPGCLSLTTTPKEVIQDTNRFKNFDQNKTQRKCCCSMYYFWRMFVNNNIEMEKIKLPRTVEDMPRPTDV